MASPLRPQFFCTRPNGTLAPLIAVDDLPSHISIRGVPRVLSPNDTQGMTSLGTVTPRTQSYVIEDMSPSSTRSSSNNAAHRNRDYDLQASLMRLASDENVPANQRMAVNALLQQGIAQNLCMASPSTSGWLVPNGNGGGGGGRQGGGHYNAKKEFCSYWIRHGECDYQQQGCLYKHEMPTDIGTLEKLGLRDIPRWYREKYGIPSLLPNGHAHPRAHISHTQHWKDESTDRPMKSIQYPSRLEINGAMDVSDVEKPPKPKSNYPSSQHSAMVPGHPRAAYTSTGSPRGPSHQKHSAKHGSKKMDLLSFEPLPEYPSLDTMGRGIGNFTYPETRDHLSMEPADRTQREEMVRNLQSLMPAAVAANPEYLPVTFDAPAAPSRSKKSQKSRRLYQPRSQMGGSDVVGQSDLDSFRNYHVHATASSSAASAMSKDAAGFQLSGPGASLRGSSGAVTSSSPLRGVSPSVHSGTSVSSQSSPRGHRSSNHNNSRYSNKDAKGLPAPIGSKKSQCKGSDESSDDDYYSMAVDNHGK